MYARGTRKPDGTVAIVAIDDKSIAELGRWPWPRTILAQLIGGTKSYHVAVVGFDMVFRERDNTGGDETFANAIKAQGTVFIGYSFQVTDGTS
jgi:adenylate cyclase